MKQIQILFCQFGHSDIEAFVEVMPDGSLHRLSLTDDQEALEAQHATLLLVEQIELIQLDVDLPEFDDDDRTDEMESDPGKYSKWWMDQIQTAWDEYKEK